LIVHAHALQAHAEPPEDRGAYDAEHQHVPLPRLARARDRDPAAAAARNAPSVSWVDQAIHDTGRMNFMKNVKREEASLQFPVRSRETLGILS
jgi:hypothetical protein